MVGEASGQGSGDVALAVDIGGTKLCVGLVGTDATVLWRATRATPRGSAEEIYGALRSLIEGATAAAMAGTGPPIVCGVGCGGPMEPAGVTVSPLNIAGWRRFPLRELLERDTGLIVHVDNDAKALALAERWTGAAVGVDNFLAMVVSTGVGGGLVVDGNLLNGRRGNAGHIGHLIVEPHGAPCACGARGCLEAEISGPAIERRIGCAPACASRAERERAGRLLGRAVGSVANLIDLDLALVGGSVALGFGEPFFAAARREAELVARLGFSAGLEIREVGLGVDAPLIGAAAVGFRGAGERLGIIR